MSGVCRLRERATPGRTQLRRLLRLRARPPTREQRPTRGENFRQAELALTPLSVIASIPLVYTRDWRGVPPPRPPDGDTAALRRFGPAVDAAVDEPRADSMMNAAGNPVATTASGESNRCAVPPLRYGRSGDSPATVAVRLVVDGRQRPSRCQRDVHRPQSRLPPAAPAAMRAGKVNGAQLRHGRNQAWKDGAEPSGLDRDQQRQHGQEHDGTHFVNYVSSTSLNSKRTR